MYQKPAQHERSVCIYVVLAVPGGEDILADYYFEPCSRDEKKSWIFEISTKLVCTLMLVFPYLDIESLRLLCLSYAYPTGFADKKISIQHLARIAQSLALRQNSRDQFVAKLIIELTILENVK